MEGYGEFKIAYVKSLEKKLEIAVGFLEMIRENIIEYHGDFEMEIDLTAKAALQQIKEPQGE